MNPFGLIFFQMGLVQPPTKTGMDWTSHWHKGSLVLAPHPRTKYTSFLDDIVAGGRVKMDFYEAKTRGPGLGDFSGRSG